MYLTHSFETVCLSTKQFYTYSKGECCWHFNFARIKKYQTSFGGFKANFLDKVAEFHMHYHLFILANYQEGTWREVCAEYNLEKYVVFTGPPSVNSNYPEDDGRIRLLILKFPPDYKVEEAQ